MTGVTQNPSNMSLTPGGEFNKYLYSVSANRPIDYIGQKLVNFTYTQLGFDTNRPGRNNICLEYTADGLSIARGASTSVIAASYQNVGQLGTVYGFRPILEHI